MKRLWGLGRTATVTALLATGLTTTRAPAFITCDPYPCYCPRHSQPRQQWGYQGGRPQPQVEIAPHTRSGKSAARAAAKSPTRATQPAVQELGPEEFTDPLLAINFGQPEYGNEFAPGLVEYSQEGPVFDLRFRGVDVSFPRDSKELVTERTYRFSVPLSFRGQVPSEPSLAGYNLVLLAETTGPDCHAEVVLGLGNQKKGWEFQSGVREGEPQFFASLERPRAFTNGTQKLTPLRFEMKVRLIRKRADSNASIVLRDLRGEANFRWAHSEE